MISEALIRASTNYLTISVNPKQGSLRHPLQKDGPVDEPRGRAIVVNFACNILVLGRIGGREPLSRRLS